MHSFALLIGAALGLVMCSCKSVDSRSAGGGAFDDSYLARGLDSNNPSLEVNRDHKDKPAIPSYSQWRHE